MAPSSPDTVPSGGTVPSRRDVRLPRRKRRKTSRGPDPRRGPSSPGIRYWRARAEPSKRRGARSTTRLGVRLASRSPDPRPPRGGRGPSRGRRSTHRRRTPSSARGGARTPPRRGGRLALRSPDPRTPGRRRRGPSSPDVTLGRVTPSRGASGIPRRARGRPVARSPDARLPGMTRRLAPSNPDVWRLPRGRRQTPSTRNTSLRGQPCELTKEVVTSQR